MYCLLSGLDNGGTSRSSDTDPGQQQPPRPLTGKSEITLDELSDLYNRCSDEDEEDGAAASAAATRPETPTALGDAVPTTDDGRRLLRQFQANHGSREDLLRTNNNNNRKKVNRLSRELKFQSDVHMFKNGYFLNFTSKVLDLL